MHADAGGAWVRVRGRPVRGVAAERVAAVRERNADLVQAPLPNLHLATFRIDLGLLSEVSHECLL